MSSTSTGASGSQDDTHWAMPSMLHNDNHHHPKSPPTHHIWANHAQVIIANNNSDIDKSMYELPPDQSYDLSQSANRRIMKQECDNADITGDELGADIGRVKVSLIQDGDQTLTLYDLNQNHEAKVHTVLTSQESCSTSSVTSVEDSSVSDTTSLPTSSTIQALLPCVVCGDKSSGKHYGQLTCEGCKSFFKRSVRKNITYTCRGNRDCSVDPQHRNQCQYCRLRKCLKAGMRREAVQRGRVNQAAAAEYYQLPSAIPPMEHGRINPCYMTNFVTVLLRAEPYPISHMQGPQALGANIPLDNICELAARLLFTAVEWARNIPFFTELPLIDQVSLLRSSWSDLFILNTAQCCPPVYVSSILSSAFQSPAGSSSDARFHQSYTQSKLIQDQLDRFSVIRLDPAEFSSVKALCLFSPDVPGLHDPGTVQNLQEKTHASLEEYDRIQYSNQPGRAGRLLLRIPALKLINPAAVENLFFIKLIGKTPIETLIRDMLLGGSSFCWPVSADTTNNSFIRA